MSDDSSLDEYLGNYFVVEGKFAVLCGIRVSALEALIRGIAGAASSQSLAFSALRQAHEPAF